MVQAWIFNDADQGDQKAPHQTNPIQPVSLETLDSLGVSYWHIPTTVEAAKATPDAGKLGEIRRQRGYVNHDFVQINPKLMPNYDEKIRMFFQEHLHEDEEIRYCLAGSGYFDVRAASDKQWIRILIEAGDMIVLPAGIYHRYTNDSNDDITVMRLFKENPIWEAINRGERSDGTNARKSYETDFITKALQSTTVSETVNGITVDVKRVRGINGESTTLQGKAQALANYPHMRAYNGMLYVSGISSRRFDNTHEGVTINGDGSVTLDITAQTHAVLSNIKAVLGTAGADMSHVVDATAFLVDMKDYAGYNKVWNQFFPVAVDGPSRTTVAVHQLPHPNLLIEIKVIAVDPRVQK